MPLRLCGECALWPALSRRQKCEECWLRGQPVTVRMHHARARLELVPEGLRRKRVPEAEWPPGRRWCAGCQTFALFADVAADGKGSRCRTCASAASHASMVKGQYGIDSDSWNALLRLQSGRCAICRRLPKTQRLATDHDHRTDEVRGLVCNHCNHDLLGGAHDSLELLRNAVYYLERPPAFGEWESPESRAGLDDQPPF